MRDTHCHVIPLPTTTTFPSEHNTLHNGLNARGVAHIDTPTVEQHTSQTEKVLGEYTPALASPIDCNDKYSNGAGVHELAHTELLAPSPPTNAGAFETPPWPNRQLKLIAYKTTRLFYLCSSVFSQTFGWINSEVVLSISQGPSIFI
ncbi:hypothetical protein PILCRDRAFT_818812 [Piloderma croceum F 1598]|uniref:Uncharacterized protein n=1 Tax=Piloderma croceum (strain F 1598) TaxID=765440 RepID=A0A0C3C2J7_PILCF|nr:hypothetical protein PILCRDRAFT_818812 [Piloderma croceum F 1598]